MARGRPKGSKNRSKTDGEQPEGQAAGVGHNGPEPLTDEEQQLLAYHHKRAYVAALAAKKLADADLKTVARRANGEGVPTETIKHLIALDSEEGRVKIAEEIAARYKAARWAGVEVGETPDLFSQPDRTPLVDKARAAGRLAALNGEFCDSPYEPGSDLGQAFIAAYQEGQAAMVALLKKRETSAPIVDHIEKAEEGDADGETGGLSEDEWDAAAPQPEPVQADDAPASDSGDDGDGMPPVPGFLARQTLADA